MWDIVIDIFIELLTINRTKDVSKNDINTNLKFLEKQQWFQNYLLDERARHLIDYDSDVRNLIGTCKVKRMTGGFYELRFERKFARLLKNKLAT